MAQATRDQIRYLEPEQFRALDQRLKKIGEELQRLNDREEALRGKVISGSSEQEPTGTTSAS